ncbi:hypothetical protein GCM10025864_02020 [Luteimicrobium album]|uniref:Uncharacterized protein n=1 Tax=Luteimicrobium album TaxID=1054550 RepID=A0ABQ6HX38_9MICO|nr:hypothetical protein GCM10025864_02020 [Luteimicrobium album]
MSMEGGLGSVPNMRVPPVVLPSMMSSLDHEPDRGTTSCSAGQPVVRAMLDRAQEVLAWLGPNRRDRRGVLVSFRPAGIALVDQLFVA